MSPSRNPWPSKAFPSSPKFFLDLTRTFLLDRSSYPQVGDWVKTFANLGIPTRDPGGGEAYGAFIATSSLDPSSLQRSYSKNAYLDPASSRSNLVVLTGYTTSKINFDGTTAIGVNFQATATSPSYTVNAAREVILAAGVIGSPRTFISSF